MQIEIHHLVDFRGVVFSEESVIFVESVISPWQLKVYIHAHICMHIHTYTHMYTYTYMPSTLSSISQRNTFFQSPFQKSCHVWISHIWSRRQERAVLLNLDLNYGVASIGRLLQIQVSFAEYSLFYRALLQKRPIILRSLLIVATPYLFSRESETINTLEREWRYILQGGKDS